jgi:hypothetical protein
LARVVLPHDCRDGILGMLTVYFDDSGTHAGSELTLLAGLFGNQYQWELFNDLWGKRLKESVPGKPPVQRFHMTDCYNSLNEFLRWNRTETDFFAHELGEIVFRCGLWGCATAVWTGIWNEHVTGDLRRASGDAEGGCIRNSFNRTLEWAREFAGAEKEIAFVFDDRPERKKEYEAVYEVFSDTTDAVGARPELVSLTFARAAKILPLQAADLFAWEFYQDELRYMKDSFPRPKQFTSKLIDRMAKSGRFRIQTADPSVVPRMMEAVKQVLPPGVQDDLEKYGF